MNRKLIVSRKMPYSQGNIVTCDGHDIVVLVPSGLVISFHNEAYMLRMVVDDLHRDFMQNVGTKHVIFNVYLNLHCNVQGGETPNKSMHSKLTPYKVCILCVGLWVPMCLIFIPVITRRLLLEPVV